MRMLTVAAVVAAGIAASAGQPAHEQEQGPAHLTLASDRQATRPQPLCLRGYHWGRYCFKPSSLGCLAWSNYRCLPN